MSRHSQTLDHYRRVADAYDSLNTNQRQACLEWERLNVKGDGRISSCDWPGFAQAGIIQLPFIEEKKRESKATISDSIRWGVWERDDFTCRHCGARQRLSVDHIIPESRGGTLEPDNLQTLCRTCNSPKGPR